MLGERMHSTPERTMRQQLARLAASRTTSCCCCLRQLSQVERKCLKSAQVLLRQVQVPSLGLEHLALVQLVPKLEVLAAAVDRQLAQTLLLHPAVAEHHTVGIQEASYKLPAGKGNNMVGREVDQGMPASQKRHWDPQDRG